MYCSYLMMKYCWALPAYGLWSWMDNSGCPCWLRSKHSVSAKPRSRPRAVSQKESSCLQRIAGLCPQDPKGLHRDLHIRACQKLPTAPFSVTDTLNTKESAGSHGPGGKAACTEVWTCCRTFFCSGPHTASSFSVHSVKRLEQHTQMTDTLPPISKD